MLASVPSIVLGLFGNAFFCVTLGLGFSILSGGLTLACMVLPILIRSVEEGLRTVPHEYRLFAASLGLSHSTTLINLLLPAAFPSLAAGLILGIGRAIAETAALIRVVTLSGCQSPCWILVVLYPCTYTAYG
jgi:phosphate transport system permease protein